MPSSFLVSCTKPYFIVITVLPHLRFVLFICFLFLVLDPFQAYICPAHHCFSGARQAYAQSAD